MLERYANVAGEREVEHLRQLARRLEGRRLVHVNSTRQGGGVAEILNKLVPLTVALGVDVSWEVVSGEADYFRCTKGMHNALQGDPIDLGEDLLAAYEATNRLNAERLRGSLRDADVVMIHDPQPLPLLRHVPEREGLWIWRCHIDLSRPHSPVWRYLEEFVRPYDASVFSLPDFSQGLDHPQFLVPPAIDPLSQKNRALSGDEVDEVRHEFGLDPDRPLLVQVSRFDRFKDPVGVIRAYKLVKRSFPGVQLVLAGGTAIDDPEGAEVLEEVREAAGYDPDLHVLLLPPDAHLTVNALQRAADVVVQKSTREGFGLTVSEGLWKGRPVVGGNVGGIRLQILQGRTGFLVNSAEGAALRIRQLLAEPDVRERMGREAREHVRSRFLMTRLLRDHLTIVHSLLNGGSSRVDLTSSLPT
ncbi:MAG: glycosyltransferase [Gemmatimonadetes bacterium]|nr:glycosyltransferase [Gemmatimonadota bacterium]